MNYVLQTAAQLHVFLFCSDICLQDVTLQILSIKKFFPNATVYWATDRNNFINQESLSVLVGFCFCAYKELVTCFVSYVNDEDTSSMKSFQFERKLYNNSYAAGLMMSHVFSSF